MKELTVFEMAHVSGGNDEPRTYIRVRGLLWDTCYDRREDGRRGPRIDCRWAERREDRERREREERRDR